MGQQAPRVVLGKGSGKPSIQHWLDKIGVKATPEQVDQLLLKVKDISLKRKGLLTESEFRNLVAQVVTP